jgi:hypothetical protein
MYIDYLSAISNYRVLLHQGNPFNPAEHESSCNGKEREQWKKCIR